MPLSMSGRADFPGVFGDMTLDEIRIWCQRSCEETEAGVVMLEESTRRFEDHDISGDPYALFNLLEILKISAGPGDPSPMLRR
jgi:hypothetical protein